MTDREKIAFSAQNNPEIYRNTDRNDRQAQKNADISAEFYLGNVLITTLITMYLAVEEKWRVQL
ncbi:hypothetical protein [Labrenzia sp. 011]|uniref:hypothetical protein n=1 Tax=Labrenzia sp. 011 TaxID=2171494 RepID=UPI001056F04E|nr:hypothetical protein [Labrenzia sp. 011]